MMMLVMTLSGGSIGGTITGAVARRLGAGDRSGAEVLAFHAVLLAVLLAGACALVFLIGGGRIYRLLGGSGAVLEQALAYSDVLFLGCVSMWVANALAAIVRATGKMLVAAKCLVVGSLVQVVVAGILVMGLGPFPKMGIAGAAAGIVIGYAVAAIALLVFLMTRSVELRLRLSGMPVKLAPMAAILKVGALASINSFCSIAAVTVITAFIARLGVDVLAGYGIGSRLEFLIIPMVFGFGAASTALVGVHIGANEIPRAHQAGWTAALYSAALSGLVGGVIAVFPSLWANLFTGSEAIRVACRTYLQIVGPFYAFFGLALCLYFASQGAGRVAWPVSASVVRVLVIVVGCVALSHIPGASPAQFFWLIAIGMVVQALISGTAIRFGAWTRGAARHSSRQAQT
jgi:putative MATE family efflux protein